MVRPKKNASKKQQKGGIDFKKIKRKIGRKLPPAKNSTNTEIKSKAIILPEQSVASERLGLALSRKGLSLKELLQQTSHHNGKVRKDALIGIRDLTHKHPEELRVHKLAIIEKLRERISDDDKVVRETLYQLLKTEIFPGSIEDISGPFVSLIMAYIFNAMTHLAVDIRLMAFKFFDLVVQHYPSSFLSHAEKILQNYGDILRKNHIFLDDKSKLKNALAGLVRCLSLLPSINRQDDSSHEIINNEMRALHAFEPEAPKEHTGFSSIGQTLEVLLPVLLNCFQELIPSVRAMPQVDAQSFDCMSSALHCIDIAVRFFMYGNGSRQAGGEVFVPSMTKGADVIISGKGTMIMLLKKFLEAFPLVPVHHSTEKDHDRYYALNVEIAEVLIHLSEIVDPRAILVEKFLAFIESALSEQMSCKTRSSRSVREKHVVTLLPFVPQLVSQVTSVWKFRLLQAFTDVFKGSKPDSSLKLACLSAIEEMLVPSYRQDTVVLDTNEPEVLGYQISWIQELPRLLILLGDKHPLSSKFILHLQLRLGQCASMNSPLAWEYDNMQNSLIEFYSIHPDDARNEEIVTQYGPFVKLPRDCQELAVSSLYYFSNLDPLLLQSVASCCLCNCLEPHVLIRIVEVLHSSYKAGHIQISDHISFLFTLLSRLKVIPENSSSVTEDNEKVSDREIFKAVTDIVCSYLSQIGDDTLVFQILQNNIINELSQNLPLENKRILLRLLTLLDSKQTILPQDSVSNLANSLFQYLIDVASYIPENIDKSEDNDKIRSCQYYFVPCFFLFYRSDKLLSLVLNLMGSSIAEVMSSNSKCATVCGFDQSSRICSIASIVLFLHNEVKLQQAFSSCKSGMNCILQNLQSVKSSTETKMNIEERQKVKHAYDQLVTIQKRYNA